MSQKKTIKEIELSINNYAIKKIDYIRSVKTINNNFG